MCNQTTMGSLDLVVDTVLAEGDLSRRPLLDAGLAEACSDIPGAMASSLMNTDADTGWGRARKGPTL